MEPMKMLEPIIQAANASAIMEPEDYKQGGLWYCGKCHTPKQTRLNIWGNTIIPCLCACGTQKRDQEYTNRKKQEEADRISQLRKSGIQSYKLRNARFETDDCNNPEPMLTLRQYVENWENMQRVNAGLLLYGGPGTGKSFGAACVANSLIEKHISVYMGNLSTILNSLGGLQGEEKNVFISDLMQYQLLILDDLGMERQTEYAQEQVSNIIDARYCSGKPLIITTNLSMIELRNPNSLTQKRIYDRILEMCSPVNFGSKGRRLAIAQEKMQLVSKLLKGD